MDVFRVLQGLVRPQLDPGCPQTRFFAMTAFLNRTYARFLDTAISLTTDRLVYSCVITIERPLLGHGCRCADIEPVPVLCFYLHEFLIRRYTQTSRRAS